MKVCSIYSIPWGNRIFSYLQMTLKYGSGILKHLVVLLNLLLKREKKKAGFALKFPTTTFT
jgi:hypothetical protein